MENEKLISIIVPLYNQEPYIEKCIESILTQSYCNFELLIIDDGSTDCSAEKVKKHLKEDERILYFYKENGGLSSARNYGLKKAKGEYVCFIDSDDYVKSKYIEELVKYMTNSVDVVIGKFCLEDTIARRSYIPNENEHINQLFIGEEKYKHILLTHLGPKSQGEDDRYQQTFMPVWKNLYRKEFLLRHSIDFASEREVMFEDYLFNAKAYYYANSIFVCDSSQYVQCLRQNSLSRSYRENYFQMLQNLKEYLDEWCMSIDSGSKGIQSRNQRMVTKWIIDAMYNLTYSKKRGLYNGVKTIVESNFTRELLNTVEEFELEFYYRFLYLLLKRRRIILLTASLYVFRKLEKLYRLYKNKRG